MAPTRVHIYLIEASGQCEPLAIYDYSQDLDFSELAILGLLPDFAPVSPVILQCVTLTLLYK